MSDGPYPRGYRLTKWFSGLVLQASRTDQEVIRRLSRVTAMPAHPHTLARPGTLARALSPARARAEVSTDPGA